MAAVEPMDYCAEVSSMRRRYEGAASVPGSMDEFASQVAAQGSARRRQKQRSIDSDEEEEMFYSVDGYAGEWLYRMLCPANPSRARLRLERLYWLSWQSVAYGVLLSGSGLMLFALGSGCTLQCEEPSRGLALLVAALLLCIPGFYSLFVLFMYVRGVKGYSYRSLPD